MMPDDLEPNEQQLLLATTRRLPAGAMPDAETAALREGFLALGGALDAAAGSLDESALVAWLEQSCQAGEASAVRLPSGRSESAWQTIFSIALAMAALMAIVRIAAPPQATTSGGNSVASKNGDPESSTVADNSRATAPSAAARGAWFDPLDDEIALAQVEFQRLSADNRGVDGSLSRMTERLEALSQELFQGSL